MMKSVCELYVIYGMYVESCTILVVVNRLSRPVVVLDGLPGLYEFKYDSATACGLPLYLYSCKLVGSATSMTYSDAFGRRVRFGDKPSDMPDILREVTGHALKIRPGSKPVKQRLRRFDEGKRRAISEEIVKLLAAGFIGEVYHPEWLANPVLVRKKSRK